MKDRGKPMLTIFIVGINAVVFFVLSMSGMTEDGAFMLEHGAMYVPYVLENGEYYRLFTSMFLHFGFTHLMNNMVMLFFLGSILEEEAGRWRYLLIYLLSGFAGNVLSAVTELKTGSYAVSAGASGAVFGVIGGLIFIVIRNHGKLGRLRGRGLLFMAACSIYHGFISTGVDNAAHIGGLVCGIAAGAVLCRKRHSECRSDAVL